VLISRESIAIKTRTEDVTPFLARVQRLADTERDSLGFLPLTAYQEAAIQGKLWIAALVRNSEETYIGHLLFGGAFPTIRVFQLFVQDRYRGCGVGSALLEHLVQEAETLSYLTITARVADDLKSNRFWEKRGFGVVRSQPGGRGRGRLILLRERRLGTPALFDLLNASTSPTEYDLRLPERLYARSPVFTVDLNVLVDVAEDRPRAPAVRKIIAAAMANTIRLFVAPELIAELQRNTVPNSDDPLLDFALGLPRFPVLPDSETALLTMELASIVFPDRSRRRQLQPRDYSDLKHLATAIHHRAAGFITSENAILRANARIRERFLLEVVAPIELAEALSVPEWINHEHLTESPSSNCEVGISELREENRWLAERFLQSIWTDRALAIQALDPGHQACPRRRLVVTKNNEVHAFASWDAPHRLTSTADAFLFSERADTLQETLVDYALFLLIRDACSNGPAIVRLNSRNGDFAIANLAASAGFRPAMSGSGTTEVFQKMCLGKIVDAQNWNAIRLQLRNLTNVELPHTPPSYCGPDTVIAVTSPQGACLRLPLHELEDLVSPALLIIPERPAAIVPIKPAYAAQLLDTSAQRQLFPKKEASLLFRRAYFSAARTLRTLSPGTILLFYESKARSGSGSVVACARAISNSIEPPQDVSRSVRRRGVLDDESLQRIGGSGATCVTVFDTVIRFSEPVCLERLREIGCVDRSNLVTSRRITYAQMGMILTDGKPRF
jgi:GNAT superfamily N-acetyltransferase/predicted nucleic acid-binding protein